MRFSAIALSSLLHGLALALILSSQVFQPVPFAPDEPIAIELVLEADLAPPEPETEPAETEPPEPESIKEIPSEPELARELPPAEESPTPEQAEVIELAEDTPPQPLEPIQTPKADVDPRGKPELPVIATDLPPPPMKPLSQDRSPALAERTLPETAPLPTPPEPSMAEPLSQAELDTIRELAKALAPPPPLPQRKPPSLEPTAPQQAENPPEPEPTPEPTPAPEATAAFEPTAEKAEPAEADETPYIHQGQIGDVAPDQLLANIEALRNEDLQAERNPELWEIIRLVRRQIARCWREDPRKPWSPNYTVDIQVAFSRQGALKTTFVQEVARMVGDEAFKAFVIEAKSALKACSPFDLPADKYGIWRSFTMRFVPRSRG